MKALNYIIIAVYLLTNYSAINAKEKAQAINMINDVSHHYSFFYAWSNKANFGGQYGYINKEQQQKLTQSQSTINKIDLADYNLYNLYLDVANDEPYMPEDVQHLKQFVENDGGGLFIVLATNSAKTELNANTFIKNFGVRLSNETLAKPIKALNNQITKNTELSDINKGRTLILDKPEEWTILCEDAEGRPLMALKKVGKGHIAASSFTPFIKKQVKGKEMPKDYKFPNYAYTQLLFKHLASGKEVNPDAKLQKKIEADKVIELEAIEILCTDYSEKFAQKAVSDYQKVYNYMIQYMGVPLAVADDVEKLRIHLLPCKGSGWSGGQNIAIGMYAPTFIGILGHEMTHSWVLPHAEPLSNEGIAIWIGNQTCIAMGEIEKGEGQINSRISRALEDPLFKEWDPVTIKGEMAQAKYSKTLKHGKYMYVCQTFEKKYGTDIIAKYFQLKRKVVPANGYKFTCHDSAWLWSKVTNEDQFPYLNSLGFSVDKNKVSIPNTDDLKLVQN